MYYMYYYPLNLINKIRSGEMFEFATLATVASGLLYNAHMILIAGKGSI